MWGKTKVESNYNPKIIDVTIRVDREMLKWLDMDEFPDDLQKLIDEIREAIYLAYMRT